jgi:hypothetical protein
VKIIGGRGKILPLESMLITFSMGLSEFTLYHPVFLLINDKIKRTLFKAPLLPGLNKAKKAFKLQIQNFLVGSYGTFINFETHLLSNLDVTMGQNEF